MTEIEKQIAELYDFAFDNPHNVKQQINLGLINSDLGQKIKIATGLDVTDFVISIDNYAILHTLRKHSSENELKRGQIPVCKSDFLLIPQVLLSFDFVEVSPEKFLNKEVLIFYKIINEQFVVRVEVRQISSIGKNKCNRLALLTMFKKKSS
jgi:hypothetical protein